MAGKLLVLLLDLLNVNGGEKGEDIGLNDTDQNLHDIDADKEQNPED